MQDAVMRMLSCSCVFLLACAGCSPTAPSADTTPSHAHVPETARASRASSARESQPPPAADPSAEARDAPPAGETAQPEKKGVAEACENLCRRVEQLCSRDTAAACRSRCRKYVADEDKCGELIQRALTCQAQTQAATICVAVAVSSCVEDFRRMTACRGGQDTVAAPQEREEQIPAGWQRVRDATLGVSVMLPPDASMDSQATNRTWRGAHAGAEYFLAALPPPDGEVTQRDLVRMVLQYLGTRCQRGLRMHGSFEVDDRTSVRFESACRDGTTWRGMLHVWPTKAVVVGSRAPAGTRVVDEAMFSSFQTD